VDNEVPYKLHFYWFFR